MLAYTHTYIHCIALHCITLHYIIYIGLHWITSHRITLHYIDYIEYIDYIHYIHTYLHTFHYISLRYITLHYITLHYTTLHYITLIHTYLPAWMWLRLRSASSTVSNSFCQTPPVGLKRKLLFSICLGDQTRMPHMLGPTFSAPLGDTFPWPGLLCDATFC